MKKLFILLYLQLALCCTTFAANYLTFTAEKDNSSFSIEENKTKSNIFYSLNNGKTWNKLTAQPVKLAKAERALLKGEEPDEKPSWTDYFKLTSYFKFRMKGLIAASGSVMSLVDGNGEGKTIPYDYCFYSLFQDCTSLTQAPELPATTLAEGCYEDMFNGCTSLRQTPELPATTLAESCYQSMFKGCTNLTQAPELPATTLAVSCYQSMFYNCTSLTKAPELPATTLAEWCYNSMFDGCTSLTKAPELPATTLAKLCYGCMFFDCTSLTKAPELPATTLAELCYLSMFSGCSNLTQAPELPATTLAKSCYNYMFLDCTSLTKAPELPAPKLEKDCYSYMFYGCKNLSRIKVAFIDWDWETGTSLWVTDVAKNGTFICPKDLPEIYGETHIPDGWTVIREEDSSTEAVAATEGTTVHTSELTIFVCNADADIEVYEVGGKLIGKARTMNGEAHMTVPQSGIYLVKTGAQTRKVVL